MAFQDGFVDVTCIRQAHDDIPFRLLAEHLIRLGHIHLLCQNGRIVPIGHTQEHAVVIGLQSEDLQIASTGHQRAVVVIGSIAQHIVVTIYLSAGFQQFYFVGESPFGKHADSLFVGGLRATERHIQIHDFLHPLADLLYVAIRQSFTVLFLEVTVIATRYGVFDE